MLRPTNSPQEATFTFHSPRKRITLFPARRFGSRPEFRLGSATIALDPLLMRPPELPVTSAISPLSFWAPPTAGARRRYPLIHDGYATTRDSRHGRRLQKAPVDVSMVFNVSLGLSGHLSHQFKRRLDVAELHSPPLSCGSPRSRKGHYVWDLVELLAPETSSCRDVISLHGEVLDAVFEGYVADSLA